MQASGHALRLRTWQPHPLLWQLCVPLALFALANLWLLGFGGDRWLADRLYAWEGGRWALREAWLTTTVIHAGGKHLSTIAWLLVVGSLAFSWLRHGYEHLRRPLAVLALSVLLSTLLISVLKHVTGMDCPWEAIPYGGSKPYVALFHPHPAGVAAGGCFPAGHASAGYAWVALYFFCSDGRLRWRWAGLGAGLMAGLVFGVSQQLRGAHYLSHDVWTLMVCWLLALSLHHASVARSLLRAALGASRSVRP